MHSTYYTECHKFNLMITDSALFYRSIEGIMRTSKAPPCILVNKASLHARIRLRHRGEDTKTYYNRTIRQVYNKVFASSSMSITFSSVGVPGEQLFASLWRQSTDFREEKQRGKYHKIQSKCWKPELRLSGTIVVAFHRQDVLMSLF